MGLVEGEEPAREGHDREDGGEEPPEGIHLDGRELVAVHLPRRRRAVGEAPYEGEGRDGEREKERGPEPRRCEGQHDPPRDEDEGRREVNHRLRRLRSSRRAA